MKAEVLCYWKIPIKAPGYIENSAKKIELTAGLIDLDRNNRQLHLGSCRIAIQFKRSP